MGDSKVNILSPSYAGNLPEALIGGRISVAVEPSADFLIRVGLWQNDPVNLGKDPPSPKESDCDAVFYLAGDLVIPSALIKDRDKWPSGSAKMGELFRLPYPEFVQRIQLENPHLRASKVEPSTEEEAKPA